MDLVYTMPWQCINFSLCDMHTTISMIFVVNGLAEAPVENLASGGRGDYQQSTNVLLIVYGTNRHLI